MARSGWFGIICLGVVLLAGCQRPSATSTAESPAVGTAPGAKGQTAESERTIAVIPKGTTHEFWKSVEAGAREAGAAKGVRIQWKGPLVENDRAQQISIVEQFVSNRVAGIVLAPLDANALLKPVQSAVAKGIPVVIIDSALKGTSGKDFVSFVATDNRQGGILAGERMAKLLGSKGNVVLLRYDVGSASTEEREDGFLEVMKKTSGIKVLVDNRYAGPTVGEAKSAALNMVDRLKQANGIFCPNESSTMGMLLALRQSNRAGKVKFVGFDTSPPLVEALDKGEIDALIAQNPVKMGRMGVEVMVDHLNGEAVEPRVDTGVTVIDRDNRQAPEVKKLLGEGE